MSNFENIMMNEKLNSYRKMIFKAGIEEKPEDIFLAIKYVDHGDEFLYIKTKDNKEYEYGYYCNRYGYSDYEELDNSNEYLRNPRLTVEKTDKDASVSNTLFFALERAFKKDHMSSYFDKICYSKPEAQYCFENGLKAFENAAKTNTLYDYENYRTEIYNFLERNEINTQENIEKLNNAPLSSKVNGVDGVSGKVDATNKQVLKGDSCEYVFVNGKEVDLSALGYTSSNPDEWGCCIHYLPLDQFNAGIKEEKIKKCTDTVHSLISELSIILETKNELTIKDLISLEDSLADMRYAINEFKYTKEVPYEC